MKFIAKKHFTFADLVTRWDCGLNDLMQAVIDGELIPCIYINGNHCLKLFTADHDAEGWLQIDSLSDGDCSKTQGRRGFHYLIWPRRTGVADCQFCFFSENATGHDEGDTCFELTSPIGIAQVLDQGVFMPGEIARVESTSNAKPALQAEENLLSTKDDTLLKLVIGMAIMGYRYDPVAKKNTATKDITNDLAALGIRIDDGTVLKYLKIAATTVLPAKPPQL
jgi:hypothetical protein